MFLQIEGPGCPSFAPNLPLSTPVKQPMDSVLHQNSCAMPRTTRDWQQPNQQESNLRSEVSRIQWFVKPLRFTLYQEKAIRLGHNQKTTKQNREIRNHSMLLLQAVIDSLSPWRPPAPSTADQIQAVIATIAPPAPSIADQMPSISHNVPLGKNMHAV